MALGVALVSSACAGTESPIFASKVHPSSLPPQADPAPPDKKDAAVAEPPPMTLPPPVTEVEDEDGGVLVDPGLDPTADFSWTQTLPGVGTCKAGRYVGGFECTMPGLTGFPLTVSGEVAFTLEGSPEEQTLVVKRGSIEGSFFTAPTMTGQLDCTRDRFNALSVDGIAILVASGTFAVALQGEFDAQTLGIEGAFSMVNDQGQTCEGTFRVGIAP